MVALFSTMKRCVCIGLCLFPLTLSAATAASGTLSPADITVYVWNPFDNVTSNPMTWWGAFDPHSWGGHAAIQVGTEYLSFSKKQTEAELIQQYSAESQRADNVFKLDHSTLDTAKMILEIQKTRANPKSYWLLDKNCSKTTALVLMKGGIGPILSDITFWATTTTTPELLRDYLLNTFSTPSSSILKVSGLGYKEINALLALRNVNGFSILSEGERRTSYCVVQKK